MIFTKTFDIDTSTFFLLCPVSVFTLLHTNFVNGMDHGVSGTFQLYEDVSTGSNVLVSDLYPTGFLNPVSKRVPSKEVDSRVSTCVDDQQSRLWGP